MPVETGGGGETSLKNIFVGWESPLHPHVGDFDLTPLLHILTPWAHDHMEKQKIHVKCYKTANTTVTS